MIIGFYSEGLQFGPTTLETSSLGGSESAMVYMAREFSKAGHDVKLFCNLDLRQAKNRRDKFGINWFDVCEFEELSMMFQFDVFFCYRYYNVFRRKMNSKLNILVNHDILLSASREQLMTYLWEVDHLFNLSKFHVEQYVEVLPELKEFIWQTKNGVDIESISKIVEPDNRSNRFVYASRPERGLETLLLIWEKLHEKLPDYELVVCGYDLGADLMAQLPKDQIDYYRQLQNLTYSMPNVKNLGSLKKEEYWSLLKSSKALLYPTGFPEISCINALESMACGTPIVSTEDFALPETVGDNGVLIKGNPNTPEYQSAFINKTIQLVSEPGLWEKHSERGKKWVAKRYTWKQVYDDWINKVLELFQVRFNRSKKAVLQNLVYNSDLVAAATLAKEHGLKDLATAVQEVINKSSTYVEEYSVGGTLVFKDKNELNRHSRFKSIVEEVESIGIKSLLDVGCHLGGIACTISNCIPDIKILGIDISEQCIEGAKKTRDESASYKENIDFIQQNFLQDNSNLSPFEGIFAGELLEHLHDTQGAIKRLESYVVDDGWVILTIPSGPWEAQSFKTRPERFHIHHFEMGDLKDLLGKKKNFTLRYVPGQIDPKGQLLGWWVVKFQKSDAPTGKIDYSRKIFTRPYEYLSCGLITLNGEDNLNRCLKSICEIADEIIICDTGSTDSTLEIAKRYTDKIFSIGNDPDGDGLFNFGWARNECLNRIYPESRWFLWIDADEELSYPDKLRKYLDSTIYKGFVLYQVHLTADLKDNKPDTPIRLFKTNQGIKFFGTIHEQSMVSLNEHIHPSLVITDTELIHYGYTTEGVRRQKCAERNIALLLKDRKLNPDREINLLLLMRDYWNVSMWEMNNPVLKDKAILHMRTGCDIWRQEFKGKYKNQYYAIAFPIYQSLLERLAKFNTSAKTNGGLPPLQVAFTLAGSIGGFSDDMMNRLREPRYYWFEDVDEYREFLTYKKDELIEKMNLPKGGI